MSSTEADGKGTAEAPKPKATIVTGGGRGIGRAISLRVAQDTAVLLVGRTQSDLESTVAEIRKNGGTADFIVGDVANPQAAERAVAKVVENGWSLTNLVCNAGIAKGGAITEIAKATVVEMYHVNVLGTMWFIQACLPTMIAQKAGNICIISSISGLKGYKYDSCYTGTKHALVGIAKSLALENAKHGIVVVPVCPSFVESEMTRRTIAGVVKHRGLSEAEAQALVASKNPQNRIIPAEEVAEAVAFVLSGKVPSLNGQPLILTGGE